MTKRKCTECGLGEPAVEFYAGNKKGGRCAPCVRISNRAYLRAYRAGDIVKAPQPSAAACEVDALTRAWGRS